MRIFSSVEWGLFRTACLAFAVLQGPCPAGQSDDDSPFRAADGPRFPWQTVAAPRIPPTGKVAWRAYGPAAFAEAARKNRPVFLFITAQWSQKARLMERTTFADEGVVTWLNEFFVPVRVERDRRPDLDLRMQQALQALKATRGCPLSVFLTPEGGVFSGGTWFPADDDPTLGRPGLLQILRQAAQVWREDRDGIRRQARELDERLASDSEQADTREEPPPPQAHAVLTGISDALAAKIVGNTVVTPAGQESAEGAAGEAAESRQPANVSQRFPNPWMLALCMSRGGAPREAALGTLEQMLRGGIYDQLGGGFHRCSSDRGWRVPRFEKTLVLNAEMLRACLQAWETTQQPLYRRAVEDTLALWQSLQDGTPWFPGSLAGGSSDMDDGAYYTWTVGEVERAVRNDALCNLVRLHYGIEESGELPYTAPHRNVLFEALPLKQAVLQAGAGIAEKDGEAALASARSQLLKARSRRLAPAVDRAIYVDGNALMAAAFMECGRALKQPVWIQCGTRTLRALLQQAVPPAGAKGGAAHVLVREGGENLELGLAQDEAALLHACAVAYETTGEADFLAAAEACLRRLNENHWDKPRGGYFFQAPATAAAWGWKQPDRMYQDTYEPSANALVALACVRLHAKTGKAEFRERALDILDAFGGALDTPFAAGLNLALFQLQQSGAAPSKP